MARQNWCGLHGNTDVPCPECVAFRESKLRCLTSELDEARAEVQWHRDLLRDIGGPVAASDVERLTRERDEARLALVQGKEAIEDAIRFEGQPLLVFTTLVEAAHEVARLLAWWAEDRKERDRLRALLREVEWEGQDGCCPVCGDEEHHPACELNAALEGVDS